MKILWPAVALAAVGLAACAELRHYAPLELQPPPKPIDRMAYDIGNYTLACLAEGRVLRFIVIENGDTLTKALCDESPPQVTPGRKL